MWENTHHTQQDRQRRYHDCIVQISKRFLVSLFRGLLADGSSSFCKHALRANAGAVCWTQSLWSGGVNNADRHQSGATGTRWPRLKCLNSSCQWVWQGESVERFRVSMQLVSPSQVHQVCVTKHTLARLRWPVCVYVSGRSCLDVVPLVTDITWSALPSGITSLFMTHLGVWRHAFSDQINGTRLTGFTPRNKEPFLGGRNVLWTWGACCNLLHLFTSTCASAEPSEALAKTYGGLLCSCQDGSFRFLDKTEEDGIDAAIKKIMLILLWLE